LALAWKVLSSIKTARVDQTQSAQGPTPAAAAYFPLVVRSLGVACSLTRRLGIQLLPQIATFSANGITSLPPLGARQSHLPHTSTCRLYRMYRTFVPLPCSYSGLSDGLAAPIRQRLPAIALSGNNIRQVFAHVCLCHQGAVCSVAGKVTVGLTSHWPYARDFSGLSTYALTALDRETSTRPTLLVGHGKLYISSRLRANSDDDICGSAASRKMTVANFCFLQAMLHRRCRCRCSRTG